MPELRDYARLARAVYGSRQAVGRWRRVAEYGRKSSAFRAALWSAPHEDVHVFAVRGTQSVASAWQDLRLLCGFEPRAWRRGEQALASAQDDLENGRANPSIVLTGHSLGGAFATALAQATGRRAVTFNAPGMLGVLGESSGRANALNVCIHGDWIRQLSGPCAGRSLHLGRARHAAQVMPGPFGIARELARELRHLRNPFAVVGRALRMHGLGAFQPWIDVLDDSRVACDTSAWIDHTWSPTTVGRMQPEPKNVREGCVRGAVQRVSGVRSKGDLKRAS